MLVVMHGRCIYLRTPTMPGRSREYLMNPGANGHVLFVFFLSDGSGEGEGGPVM